MPEAPTDRYTATWSARQYLEQYYSTGLTADDAANARFALERLRTRDRRLDDALELGCGPTPHHAFSIAPFVERITLADYLPANLAEARAWVERDPRSFDWDRWMGGMLAVERETDPTLPHALLADRQRRLRSVVREFAPADILRDLPLGRARSFDLVTSYYCLEALGLELDGWRACMHRLASLVAPGGALLMSVMRNARCYRVFDQDYPVTPLDEHDFAALLPELGFERESLRVEVASVPEFAAEGFDSVCCVFASKPR